MSSEHHPEPSSAFGKKHQAMDISNRVVLAPMVRGSELAFRQMIRSLYPNMLCYSPMLRAQHIVAAVSHTTSRAPLHEDAKLFLRDISEDASQLVVQVCGSSPSDLYQASRAILRRCRSLAGLDLNLGCPQSCARDGHFGAYLAEHTPHVALECIKAMRRAILEERQKQNEDDESCCAVLSCKIRLQPSVEKTLSFARSLQDAGVDLIAVHCRQRDAKFDGDADLIIGKQIVDALDIPVWINGSHVNKIEDVSGALEETGSPRLMLARDFLANPRVLLNDTDHSNDGDPISADSRAASMAAEYLLFASRYPPPTHEYIQLHIKWIFRSVLQPARGKDDYTNWRHRLWNFLRRPYLQSIEQYRYIVALFVSEAGSGNRPPSLTNIPQHELTYNTIRHLNKSRARQAPHEQQAVPMKKHKANDSSTVTI